MVSTPHQLTVYKASAGSGKTFRLVVEYIKQLIANPYGFRSILAVTFTNKATEEMKLRILGQLYGISRALKSSDGYLNILCKELQIDERTVRERAALALHLLLHNYSDFHITTIDSFFQIVLRNLARELDLPPNLNIGLNDTQVMEEAVDRMIEELKPEDETLRWVMDYVNEKIGDDKSWNIIKQVKDFGATIFKDYYKLNSKALHEKLSEKGFFTNYNKRLRLLQEDALNTMKHYADEFAAIMQSASLTTDDLAGKNKGIASFFKKLQNGIFDESIINSTVEKALDSEENWVTKKHERREAILNVVSTQLLPLLRKVVDEREKRWSNYQSAKLTLANINQLRLLQHIERKVRQLNDAANRFLLSDTQGLLYSLIQENDSPFIFEKIGARLDHIMIDEFQDTSSIQWNNFKVLLEECMSRQDAANLIVGDVKQSIYRWRAGDWRLLNGIDGEFVNRKISIETLSTNYRSAANIIRFNNTLFRLMAETEETRMKELDAMGAEQLHKAYSDVEQKMLPNNKDEGYVNITLIGKTNDFEERNLTFLADNITDLMKKGVRPEEIAILARNNNEIKLIAEYLNYHCPEMKVVSDEAFRLDASLAVNILVTAMNFLAHPDDILVKADLIKAYRYGVMHDDTALDMLLCSKSSEELDLLLPRELTEQRQQLLMLPLPELSERLYQVLALDKLKEEGAYLMLFHDCLLELMDGLSTDIDGLMEEWEENYAKRTIQTKDQQGVRVLSIHNSKGLEFENVFLPFCDWQLEKGHLIWCMPKEAPFNELPLVPINYTSKALIGTIYEKDYSQEFLQDRVDHLNLLYVALTRAVKRLFVVGRSHGSMSNRSYLIAEVMDSVAEQLDMQRTTFMEEEDEKVRDEGEDTEMKETIVYEYGQLDLHNVRQEGTTTENIFLQPMETTLINMVSTKHQAVFIQSNMSRKFVEEEDSEDTTSKTTKNYLSIGRIMHQLFAEINSIQDIGRVAERYEREGLLEQPSLTAQKLIELIMNRMKHPQVKRWFDGSWRLYNECSIIDIDPTTGELRKRRPDRVMMNESECIIVDFKFGTAKEEHRQQVAEYMQMIEQMGHQNVKGFLWYVYENKVIKI